MRGVVVRRWVAVGALVLGLGGCLPEDLGDLGGGGGGGGDFLFTAGYVYTRSDTHDVYLVDDGDPSNPRRLTTDGNASTPSLSEDGRRVVYAYNVGGRAELRTVLTDGSAPPSTLFALPSTVDRVLYPVFSPDGTKVVFAYHQADLSGTRFLGWVRADGAGGLTRLAVDGTLVAFGGASFYPTSQGNAVLVPVGSSTSSLDSLRKVSLDTGGFLSTVITNLGTASTVTNRVALSPDGTLAAFDGKSSGGSSHLYRVNLTVGGTPAQMTNSGADASDVYPSFINASRVGFGSNAGGNDNVYEVPASASASAGTLVVPGAIEPFHGPLRR